MQTLIVKTDTATHAQQLAALLKEIGFVKSVKTKKTLAPLTAADWVRPGRPATDEEIERMLDECEKSPLLSSKEARKLSMKEFTEWKKVKK